MNTARALWWELAIARKLHRSALADRRYHAANNYAKCIEALERRAREFLTSQEGK